MNVKVTACNNTATSATIPINSQLTVPVGDKVKFYEIIYNGTLTLTIYVGAPCAPSGALYYPSECYDDFSFGGDQASGFTFFIW